MQTSQLERARRFRALHEAPGCFVVPNPWDAGTARLLAALGFEALATTSAGCAFSLGRSDGRQMVSAEQILSNARDIANATDLPVSADLENGWSAEPGDLPSVIHRAAQAGLVGVSIEDASGKAGEPIYEFRLAVERVRAAAEASRQLDIPFTLTARAENFLHGRPDLGDTIRRLQAFQEAGADVLYAPGLPTKGDIASVVASVDRPLNIVMGLPGFDASVRELAELGVSRISLGSSLIRTALGEFVRAAREILEHGTFTFAPRAMAYSDLNALFAD
jgi:2-methylisocitrate lyase-like PEP mutase family enzyme